MSIRGNPAKTHQTGVPWHTALAAALITGLASLLAARAPKRGIGPSGLGAESDPVLPGPLHVSTDNPRYFADASGNVVYLAGSHTWLNFQDIGGSDPPPVFDYPAYLDFLVANNHNRPLGRVVGQRDSRGLCKRCQVCASFGRELV